MIDLSFFYSAKMAIVFILMLLLSATLEAQRNENDKFFDLMTAIGEYFGGEFNDAEKALELDLNGANSFLEELQIFATFEIVRKNENGQFECKKSKKPDFKMAIKAILDDKSFKKLDNLIKGLSAFSEEKLFNLLFSLGARLEALVHGTNSDGTLKKTEENLQDKIQTVLAVPKCFQESELSIFDYWIEIIKMKTKNSQKPIFGVAIYKEKCGKWGDSKEKAFELSRKNYEILKQLNDQKFSIFETSNLLRATFNQAYTTYNYGDEATNRECAAKRGKQKCILRGKIPQIFVNLLNQINSVFYFYGEISDNFDKNEKCAYAKFFQNISESLMKMMSAKGIDPDLHFDSEDKEIRGYVQKEVEESCKKFDNEESKIKFLNNVHYELAINFDFNQRKDVHDRAEDLLSNWKLSEKLYLKENALQMLDKIKHFTSEKTIQEKISISDALIGKEFNLGALFDQIKTLVEETIPEEEANFEKAKKEINTEQLEKDINFLKNNPKRIAEGKYQKAVAIICTIKQLGEKVKMLTSKNKTFKIKEQLDALSSRIENYTNSFGPKLWKQMEESCNQLKPKQIEMAEEILFKDIQFEIDEIWKSIKEGWKGIEEYFLSIPLMQLTEQARTLAKTFGKMLQNVKEHYAQ